MPQKNYENFFENFIEPDLLCKLAIDALPSALLVIDQEGVIRYVNNEVENVFGWKRDELIGQTIEILIPSGVHEQHQLDRSAYIDNPQPRPMGKGRHLQSTRRDGVQIPVEIGLNPIKIAESVYVLCSAVDMTYQKQMEDKMRRLANELEMANMQLTQLAITDQLTGILNRRAFDEQLISQCKLADRAKFPISLAMIDIDHFKKINDTFGHSAGDETLQITAQLITDTARNTDIAARYGGEEFALVFPDTGKKGSLEIAERYRIAVKNYSWPHGVVTVSIGIATLLPSDIGKEDAAVRTQKFIQEADKALYYSKENGRDQVTHASELS